MKFAVLTLKVEQDGISLRVMHPKDAEGIANSVDPDQTAPLIWVCTVFLRVMHPKDAEGIANSVEPDQTAPPGVV